jgi:hypothetical protein
VTGLQDCAIVWVDCDVAALLDLETTFVRCPECGQYVKASWENKQSMEAHGRCYDCQNKWKNGELPKEDE